LSRNTEIGKINKGDSNLGDGMNKTLWVVYMDDHELVAIENFEVAKNTLLDNLDQESSATLDNNDGATRKAADDAWAEAEALENQEIDLDVNGVHFGLKQRQ